MRPSIEELQHFYGSRQGQLARRLILTQIRNLWPDLSGLSVVGIGFATPFLPIFDEALRTIAVMPAQQGVARWPADAPNRATLAREDDLPLADGAVDRVLLVHALEAAPDVDRLTREVWRVLVDGGRMLAIVPNRTGLWGFSERTPFGHGQPYSKGQLEALMKRHLFAPSGEGRALYLPPTGSRLLDKIAIPTERLGHRLVPNLSGVVMIEAEKRIYVGRPEFLKARTRERRYVPLPTGAMASRGHWSGGQIAACDCETAPRSAGPR
jgi:SAM-dependent methyltransferase